MTSRRLACLASACVLLAASARAAAEPVPIDFGIGPAFYFITGPVGDDQPVHTGVKISLHAVLDQAFIQAHQDRVPPRYRKMAASMREVRYSPSPLIPDALLLSPRIEGTNRTGIWGATWRPLSFRTPLAAAGAPVQLDLGAGLLLTYFYLHSDALPTTHFLRPGIDLGTELAIAFGRHFLVSVGWASGLYVPQKPGSFEIGKTGESIWHLGQAFLKLHFRFTKDLKL